MDVGKLNLIKTTHSPNKGQDPDDCKEKGDGYNQTAKLFVFCT